jgi:hypothetical protein
MAESSGRDLRGTLHEFVMAPGWTESRWILAMHPELLTDEADTILSQITASAREMGMTQDAEEAATHQRLLRLSREIGSKAAFAQLTGRDVPPLSPELLQLCDSAIAAESAFQASGDKKQLQQAVETLEAGLRQNSGQLDRAPLETVECAVSIAIGLRFRSFLATRDPDDLIAALAYWDNLLAVASGSVSKLSAHTAGVAGGLLLAAHQCGLETLPAAITALERAISAGQPGEEQEGAIRNLQYARSLAAK